MKALYKTCLCLVIIGAINWGMIGLFNVNLVELIFGRDTFFTNLIYTLVGICGLVSTGILFRDLEPIKE